MIFSRFWLLVCLFASWQVAAHTKRGASRLVVRPPEVEGLSNGERIRRGLPLKKPARRGTPRYHAFQPRASDGATNQNTVIQATTSGPGRRAGQYISFDATENAFKLTSDLTEAATFNVPASTVGPTQVRMYTSDGLYYLGASAQDLTTSSTTFQIQGVKTSDLGNPSSSQVQTTIWTFGGIPGGLTGSFFSLSSSSTLFLSFDDNNYIIATSTEPDPTRKVSFSLATLDSVNTVIHTATAPADGGAVKAADTTVDTDLSLIDTALNTGAGGDENALVQLMGCLTTGSTSPECEALLAGLSPP